MEIIPLFNFDSEGKLFNFDPELPSSSKWLSMFRSQYLSKQEPNFIKTSNCKRQTGNYSSGGDEKGKFRKKRRKNIKSFRGNFLEEVLK